MRTTIDKVGGVFASSDLLSDVVDRGHRRYRCWAHDFDSRAIILATKIGDHWEAEVKKQWEENKERILQQLRYEFGEANHAQKMQNFIDIGPKPFSIVTYHNALFDQARSAFVIGAYYPALTGASALGERILNHLVLDLRDCYRATPEYKHVYRKKSFVDWQLAIDTLTAWGVLLPETASEFTKLQPLRHRSLHFSPDTYPNLRDDALAAIIHIREIVGSQFSAFGIQPWFIVGTPGACFIKRHYENHPFIHRYFLPQSPFVGVHNGIEFDDRGRVRFIDFHDYGDGELTDEEYRDAFNHRDLNSIARSTVKTDQPAK